MPLTYTVTDDTMSISLPTVIPHMMDAVIEVLVQGIPQAAAHPQN